VTVVAVESTEELCAAVTRHLPGTDVLIMAAAPADFRAADPAPSKRPRAEGPLSVTLEPTVDVLGATLRHRPRNLVTVGFALETGPGLEPAREKLRAKRLDLIVLNDATEPGAGFEVETNRVTLVTAAEATPLPLMSKRDVAEKILDRVEALA
jgi:phosphopantothenoylcysteine decarboxylase/phosphopantothenate--cysteine ligase